MSPSGSNTPSASKTWSSLIGQIPGEITTYTEVKTGWEGQEGDHVTMENKHLIEEPRRTSVPDPPFSTFHIKIQDNELIKLICRKLI